MIAPGNQWIFDSLRGAPPRRPSRMIAKSKHKHRRGSAKRFSRGEAVMEIAKGGFHD